MRSVEAEVTGGTCGSNLMWTLDDEGVLIISGTGKMRDYGNKEDSTLGRYVTTAPWGGEVKAVVFEQGVTSIGNEAFYGCSSLSSISIPDGMTGIGSSAFKDCSSLIIIAPDKSTAHTFAVDHEMIWMAE